MGIFHNNNRKITLNKTEMHNLNLKTGKPGILLYCSEAWAETCHTGHVYTVFFLPTMSATEEISPANLLSFEHTKDK